MDSIFEPVTVASEFLSSYGWLLLGVFCSGAILWKYLIQERVQKLQQWREDARHHKNPELALARLEALQAARERQQALLLQLSAKAEEAKAQREQKKREENLQRLEKYGSKGHTLRDGSDFLPLSGGASASSYRPPKRSACAKGGCGK